MSMEIPLETASSLRVADRQVNVPFQIALADGRVLELRHLLRILPGKRITGIGEIAGQTFVAKLFIGQRDSERHWKRERQGIELLLSHDLPTPKLLSADALSGGGHYVLTEFIDDAQSLSSLPETPPLPALKRLFNTLGRMHAQGLIHEDAHFGNFLIKGNSIFILDGDAVQENRSSSDLTKNLALLLAQLPTSVVTGMQRDLLAAYCTGNPGWMPDTALFDQVLADIRKRRLKNYLSKCLRDCSSFKVLRESGRFVVMVRSEADFLAPIIADPDRWLSAGTLLKCGNTATLAMVEHGDRRLVIKRYNIKGPGHALSRCWRPSRAWHSWVEGHRLRFHGIATPRPLALIEQRIGPLRGIAWLITEYCEGESLIDHLAAFVDSSPPEAEKKSIRELFQLLLDARINHGDLKATNLLWNADRLYLIDLDAMHQHTSSGSFRRAWRKNRIRFLRNWPSCSALRDALDAVLPPAD